MVFFKTKQNKIILSIVFLILLSAAVFSTSNSLSAQQAGNLKTFASPEKAVEVFIGALKAGDQKELSGIFGADATSQFSSGDTVRDMADKEKFLNAYMTRNFLEKRGRDRVVLHVGNEDWPFPIPIVRRGNVWVFDFDEGKDELLNRRIGRNELRVMETMETFVAAQREYAHRDPMNKGVHAYAQQILSTPGKKDGLYWPVKEGEKESPLGPLAAMAAREGYKGNKTAPAPFEGYYFKILTAQGKHAPGGEYDYIRKGKMIFGFGLLAYPAKYGSSGIMTFVVNQQGVVHQKDLGVKTAEIAAGIEKFNPDKTWLKVKTAAEGDVSYPPDKSHESFSKPGRSRQKR